MDFYADLRYAFRLLRKTPVFTIAAIGTLALGIGANTTIFSLVQTVLLRPLPYQDPDRVVMVWEDNTPAGFPRNSPAPGNFNDWRARNRSFTDMAATRFAFATLTMDGALDLATARDTLRLSYRGDATLGNVRMLDRVTSESVLSWNSFSASHWVGG